MQRTGRQEMALRLHDEGPSAAADYAILAALRYLPPGHSG
jgi:hypothetical protein